MRNILLFALLFSHLAVSGDESTTTSFAVGDGTVNGLAVSNYAATWRQCQLQEGEWVSGGTVTETATVIGGLFRHEQLTQRPDGMQATSTSYLDHASLAPLRLEQVVHGPDGNLLGQSARALNEEGFSGWTQSGDAEKQAIEGTQNSKQFNGAMLGLPVSTLDFSQGAYEFESFMMMFNASYRVIVTLAGEETLEHEGAQLNTNMVDVEWHHDNGDVYPPGPDASGGRFWILNGEKDGIPRVLRYKTDAYSIEFTQGFCPAG